MAMAGPQRLAVGLAAWRAVPSAPPHHGALTGPHYCPAPPRGSHRPGPKHRDMKKKGGGELGGEVTHLYLVLSPLPHTHR